MPQTRGLAHPSAALPSVADSPTLDFARAGRPPSRRRPPPPCSCTHQTPLICIDQQTVSGERARCVRDRLEALAGEPHPWLRQLLRGGSQGQVGGCDLADDRVRARVPRSEQGCHRPTGPRDDPMASALDAHTQLGPVTLRHLEGASFLAAGRTLTVRTALRSQLTRVSRPPFGRRPQVMWSARCV